ncbi:H-NS family nucleoid-associated regulatory protein [Rhodanobacter sp. 115]|uniref:H-NS histone family protein n=1 Tax=Rhodanobacter sp. FW021-MT20 TaxID=1162282 RepID=UPI0034E4C4DE
MVSKASKEQRGAINVNVSEMSTSQLRELQKAAAVSLAEKAAERAEQLRSEYARVIGQMTAIGAEYGITLNRMLASTPAQLLSQMKTFASQDADRPGGSVKKHQVVPPKYRNPANPAQMWTGRGNRPTWVTDWLAAHPGGKMSELLASPHGSKPRK